MNTLGQEYWPINIRNSCANQFFALELDVNLFSFSTKIE